MPTTGIFNGTNLVVLVGTEVVAHSTSCSLSVSTDLPDSTTKDSGGWSEILEGLRSWEVSGDFLLAQDASYGIDDLDTIVQNRTKVTLRFSSETTGDNYWNGNAYMSELSVEAATEESVSFSVSFTGTGAINYTTLT